MADRLAALLVLLAGLFAAWACARAGAAGFAALACATAGGTAATQAISWTRSRRPPAVVLERRANGCLQVRHGAGVPVPLAIGAGTRLVGPSVYLDVTFESASHRRRIRRWITPVDAPATALRRWTVLLPGAVSQAS